MDAGIPIWRDLSLPAKVHLVLFIILLIIFVVQGVRADMGVREQLVPVLMLVITGIIMTYAVNCVSRGGCTILAWILALHQVILIGLALLLFVLLGKEIKKWISGPLSKPLTPAQSAQMAAQQAAAAASAMGY